jgi:hypothetical protein
LNFGGDAVDTRSATGRLMLNMFAAIRPERRREPTHGLFPCLAQGQFINYHQQRTRPLCSGFAIDEIGGIMRHALPPDKDNHRFTVAHEAGHAIMHVGTLNRSGDNIEDLAPVSGSTAPMRAPITSGSTTSNTRGGNSVPAIFGTESQASAFIRARIAEGLLFTPMRLHHGTTFMSVSRSNGSTIKKPIRWMVPARTKPRSISAAYAALKSASTITLRARTSSGTRRSPLGGRITAASPMEIR